VAVVAQALQVLVVVWALAIPQQLLDRRVMVNHLGGYYTPVRLATAAQRLNLPVSYRRVHPSFRRVKRPLLRRLFPVQDGEVLPHYFLSYVRVDRAIARAALLDKVMATLLSAWG